MEMQGIVGGWWLIVSGNTESFVVGRFSLIGMQVAISC
jgi:hypothetical protein